MGVHISAAREISYATTAKTRRARAVIRAIENSTGRIRVIRQVRGYDKAMSAGQAFWDVVPNMCGLKLDIVSGSLDNIPKTGPVVLLSNHPFGMLDGLMLGQILSRSRGDFKILAHRVFARAKDLDNEILPISFDETREAMALNLNTRKEALKYLADGGAIGVFPGGSVSSPSRRFGRPMDPKWRTFSAKMIAKSDATVVPIFFDGYNSRRFHMFGKVNRTVRTALLISEFKRRMNKPVRVHIGKPLDRDALETYVKDPTEMMDFLRTSTYNLSSNDINDDEYGFDF
ncbi:MAG: lysophospholipid acyltransferase family protein [Paracoccaceae bacterium]